METEGYRKAINEIGGKREEQEGLHGRLIEWCCVPLIRWRQRPKAKERTVKKTRRLETETRCTGHSEEKKVQNKKTSKAKDKTGKGIRERLHFDENAER